jgi:ATP-dependent RNA helicase DeaD
MNKFRAKNLQILVATDVAARGLDVNDLSHVINYNLPDEIAGYTHRSGRTGRAGRTGTSVAIIHMKEHHKIKQIEQKLNKKFKQCRIPSGLEICKKQLVTLIDVVTQVEVNHEQINPLYAEIAAKLESLDREELIKKFVSVEFNRFLEYYKNAPDLNVSDREKQLHGKAPRNAGPVRRGDADNRSTGGDRGQKFTRFYLNVGRRQGIMPQGLIGKINGIPGGGRIKVGKIEIQRNSASLEADSRFTPQILDAFQHVKIDGKAISIEVARANSNSSISPSTGHSADAEMRQRKGRKYKAA